MAYMSPADKLLKLAEVAMGHAGADPAEVAQVFKITFALIAEVQKSANSADDAIRQEADRKVRKLKQHINGIKIARETAHTELRRIVDKLLKWQEKESKKTDNIDVADAIALGEINAADIENLRRRVKKLKLKSVAPGVVGPIPDHEWDGTRIRFELPDGTWGEWTDLRGMPGEGGGFSLFGNSGAGMGGVRRIRAGSNILISGDPGEPTISSTASGSGTTLSSEDPSETPDDSSLAYTFATKPFLIVINRLTYRENHGWTWNASTSKATISSPDPGPVGVGGEIYGLVQS